MSRGTRRPGLAPCPDSPNCVSSRAKDEGHRVEPFRLEGDPDAAWADACDVVAGMPRTSVETRTDEYLHAVCRSLLLRFADDLELLLDRSRRRIDVRSASRVGYSDLGANRRRVETLRRLLGERGLLR